MNKLYVASLASLAWTVPGTAQQVTRRANIIGNEVDGKCTIEVRVYGALKSRCKATSGSFGICRANGRCGAASCATGVCPKIRTTSDFAESTDAAMFNSFGIHGRTAAELSFGSMIRMAAREGYTVDLEWRGSNGGQWTNQDTRGWRGPDNRDGNQGNFGDGRGPDDANRDRRYYDEQGRWNSDGTALAIRVCEAAATQRIQRDGFRNVTFRNVVPDNNPGRNDFVNGYATAQRGWWRGAKFQFSCSVNLSNGQVRSIDVRRRQ